MPLSQAHRTLLIQTVITANLSAATVQNLVNAVRPGIWGNAVPLSASLADGLTVIVDRAATESWLRGLVAAFAQALPGSQEIASVLDEVSREPASATAANAFEEVWLDGNRPFVNRRALRNQLLDLVSAGGARVLLVDGPKESGKSYSYYLMNHAASRQGFVVSQFKLAQSPTPDQLADEIVRRIGAAVELPPPSAESAVRRADKLADVVKNALEQKATPRFFIFDEFPASGLPTETVAFVVRLATYADQELRALLRIVLVRFPGTLPPDLDDVAARDDVQPFSAPDMVAVVMQVAAARGWRLSEGAVQTKINELEAQQPPSLRHRVRFLQKFILQLAEGNARVEAPAVPAGAFAPASAQPGAASAPAGPA
jgi:hypothetical protein